VMDVSAIHHRHGYGGLRFHRITLCAAGTQAVVPAGGRIDLQIDVRVETPVKDVELAVLIDLPDGAHVCECPSTATLGRIERLEPGDYRLTCTIGENVLNPGRYAITPIARSGQKVLDHVPGAMPFEIAWSREGAPHGREDLWGLVRLDSTWTAPAPATGP